MVKMVSPAVAVGLLAFALVGCSLDVSGPDLVTERCLVENPPPDCQNNNLPTDNLVPVDESSVLEVVSGR